MSRKRKNREVLYKYKQKLWERGREGGSRLEAGTEFREVAEGMSENKRCLLFSFTFLVTVTGLVPQTCLTLCDPLDCSLPGSSVHGILQARILEWVAVPSSRRSS